MQPYLETPKQYAAPYAKKADELASSGLSHIESTFPIVKDDTSTIVDKGKALAWWPFKLANDSKDYVFSTYNGKLPCLSSRHPEPSIGSPSSIRLTFVT